MTLGQMLAALAPRTQELKCPTCGGRLLASATVYVKTPVYAESIAGSVRVMRHQRIIETKKAMEAELERLTDDRDELHCENYDVHGGCTYWVRVADIEQR